ncbi:C45 family peptidase [Streptomyces sp. NBC_00572]|uniref:C45 family autoproteolytic acyltransferase/hydolase n=1 Tax=Streptomyces sp. NBC_00572 TaxID=2903664 RepID=UPI00224D0FF4|nr:C45 family peptidase [Streptomyces sp. NBC_00572]MCX4979820.1 C45 family peptidase [Streptomyces sp. NBC_00572]
MNGPRRTTLRIAGDTPRRRGQDRGRQARAAITRAWRVYEELFATVAAGNGRTLDVPALALRTVHATRAWAPELVEEMEGVAEGAGMPFWTIAALNARTEILAEAGAPRTGECSTLVRTGPRTTGGQCWDWHRELADAWHLQTVTGDVRGFAGITEHGILAKIGVNEAGVGVLFNILGHADDAATGVPVHLVARQVLGTAGSFAEAVGMLTGAPVSASTVITVVTADRAASVELAPAGSAVVAPDDRGWLVRTNHFLAPALVAGELRGRREPETYDRHRLLTARAVEQDGETPDADALVGLLTAHREDGAEVCCHAPAEGRLGSRWATLATVAVDPAERRLLVHEGGPCSAGRETWIPLTAPRR